MKEYRMLPLITGFSRVRALVLGDVMLDRYIYGKIARISPEAPVPILSVVHETAMPGGAANVASNIASLGGSAVLMGVIGEDKDGEALCCLLNEAAGIENRVIAAKGRPTTTKIRFSAETQQMIRVDNEVRTPLAEHVGTLLAAAAEAMDGTDVVVLSDYAKGVLCDEVVRGVIALAAKAGKPVVVDPKSVDAARYNGATVVTPNLSEAAQMSNIAGRDDAAVVAMAEVILAKAPDVASIVITRGADGMSLAVRGDAVRHLSVSVREVADVSGAGDTVVAALSLSLAAGGTLAEAVKLANIAAGIAVGKAGTAEVTAEELNAAIQSEHIRGIVAKTATAAQAEQLAEQWRRQGLRVGFTNGCFDLIHPGHVSLLRQAKSHCDKLIVGMNTDESVKRLKGPGRPVQDELARAVVLGALSPVDMVVPFAEDTPIALIRGIRPDVLVKGADYTVAGVVGADFVMSYNGRVVLAELTPNQSTTGIISRIDTVE